MLLTVTEAIGGSGLRWRVTPAADSEHPWIFACPVDSVLPQQGWKLHISSHGSTADETLTRALRPLIDTHVPFKVLGSATWLDNLNRGGAGLSQVGKFITAYPPDELSAVDIAIVLEQATRGLNGPQIPSDRVFVAGSVVSYRYGGFSDLCMQTRLGEVVLALTTPDGRLIPDRRGVTPSEPPWVSDPFKAQGFGAVSVLDTTVGGRYRPVSTLARSPGAVVQLALDLATPRVCVLKRFRLRPGRRGERNGDLGGPLRREVNVLRRLAGHAVTAVLYDVVHSDDELVLVLEDLGGDTLDRYVHRLMATGEPPSSARLVELGVAIAGALSALHDRGFVHGDLKSANIVLAPDDRPRLIDFDLAYPIGSVERVAGAGTRGYVSPESQTGERVSPADDIYALGAILYLLMTGAEPSRAPDVEHLLARSPMQLNLNASRGVVRVLERCLAPDPADRYGRASDVGRALLATVMRCPGPDPGWATPVRVPVAVADALEQARQAGDYLCAEAETSAVGITWRSRYFVGKGAVGRDVNTGMAGTILSLCELVDEFGDQRHTEVLSAAAWTLHRLPPIPGEGTFGLYVGGMGIVAALLRAGQVLSDGDLVQAAVDRASRLPPAGPEDSPDLFHGIAGRIRADLLLWDETGDSRILDRAAAAGDVLVGRREGSQSQAYWRIPAGYAGLSGKIYLGYAHGAAGIADVFLDLAEATGDSKYFTTAGQAIGWISGHAVAVLDDHSGLGWPAREGQRPSPPFWCHGATGIGQLFLHARNRNLDFDTTPSLHGIARAVARAARWSGPTLCHGLAGNAEFLLEAGRSLGDVEALAQAHELMTIVDAFGIDTDRGRAWISEPPRQVNPDYLVGFAGVPLVLLRLARPERPHQLSRAGFMYRSSRLR